MKKIFVALVLIAGLSVSAQIKIGANPTLINAGSLLELESSTKGLKFPEVALTSTTAWLPLAGTQVMGMTVYNTATAGDVTPGLYTNNGTVWVKNEGGAASSIPTWRSDSSANVLILASDGNNFVRATAATTSITLPVATNAMLGKVFTVFEISGNNSPGFIVAIGGGVYKGTNVPNANPFGGYQFVTDGTDWYNIGSN
jgi:hypothetical protein